MVPASTPSATGDDSPGTRSENKSSAAKARSNKASGASRRNERPHDALALCDHRRHVR
jgi:hypothetical protein